VFGRLREDIETVLAKDPAARNTAEILLCYPGLHALWFHRVAAWLWRHRLRLLARLLCHISRFFTGIEIHPGARIGRRFFIDHGMGVVIGETAEIGDDVLVYQGAVLGGTSLQKTKRHPTVEDNVVIGAGAMLLGPITVGKGARIGAGSVVVKPVPAGATIVGVPGRIVGGRGRSSAVLQHADLPDPVAEMLRNLAEEQERIKARLAALERSAAIDPGPEADDASENLVLLQHGAGI